MPRKQSKNAKAGTPAGKKGHAGEGIVLPGEREYPTPRHREVSAQGSAQGGGKNISAPFPAREEWDFSACPEDELWDCWTWETSRNRKKVRERAAELRASCLVPTFNALWEALTTERFGNRFGWPHHWLYFSEAFPTVPYLKVPFQERRQLRKQFRESKGDRAAKAGILEKRVLGDLVARELVKTGREKGRSVARNGSTETVVLDIPWYMSNRAIIELFSAWLAERRPADIKQRERRGHASGFEQLRTSLKRLSVWRLLHSFSVPFGLADRVLQKLGISLYENSETWSRERAKMQRVFDGFDRDFGG